jgi:hypothetical protein
MFQREDIPDSEISSQTGNAEAIPSIPACSIPPFFVFLNFVFLYLFDDEKHA